jgi:hypothetical protein
VGLLSGAIEALDLHLERWVQKDDFIVEVNGQSLSGGETVVHTVSVAGALSLQIRFVAGGCFTDVHEYVQLFADEKLQLQLSPRLWGMRHSSAWPKDTLQISGNQLFLVCGSITQWDLLSKTSKRVSCSIGCRFEIIARMSFPMLLWFEHLAKSLMMAACLSSFQLVGVPKLEIQCDLTMQSASILSLISESYHVSESGLSRDQAIVVSQRVRDLCSHFCEYPMNWRIAGCFGSLDASLQSWLAGNGQDIATALQSSPIYREIQTANYGESENAWFQLQRTVFCIFLLERRLLHSVAKYVDAQPAQSSLRSAIQQAWADVKVLCRNVFPTEHDTDLKALQSLQLRAVAIVEVGLTREVSAHSLNESCRLMSLRDTSMQEAAVFSLLSLSQCLTPSSSIISQSPDLSLKAKYVGSAAEDMIGKSTFAKYSEGSSQVEDILEHKLTLFLRSTNNLSIFNRLKSAKLV